MHISLGCTEAAVASNLRHGKDIVIGSFAKTRQRGMTHCVRHECRDLGIFQRFGMLELCEAVVNVLFGVVLTGKQ